MPLAAGVLERGPDRLAREYMPLARRRADRIAFETGLPGDEARSAALLGLAEAIDRYDRTRGPFGPFACRTIDGRVRAAARDWRWRRRGAPQPGRELVSDEQLVALVPDRLTTDELSHARSDIVRALGALDHTERQVILLHGKLGHSLASIARMLELDAEHTRYLWRRALGKMRAQLGA